MLLVIGVAFLAAVAALGAWYLLCDADLAALRAARALPPANAFKDKVVWITGASSGIGEALAYILARQGAVLVLSARRMDKLTQVATACSQLGSPNAFALKLDVEDMASHAAVAQLVVNKFKRIDYLVNNAGRSQRSLVEETPLEIDRQMFELNVFAVFSLTKAVLPYMIKQNSGHIVVTSSVAGKTGSPCSGTYAATKFAVQGFFNTLRMEVADRNIHVTTVCPGPVTSEILAHAFTPEVGKTYGAEHEDTSHRMSAERCAQLMAGAMYFKLPEVWAALQPILLFTYIGQYFPTLYFKLGVKAGAARVADYRKGDKGYGALRNPLRFLSGKPPAEVVASSAKKSA